jgi:hypothetical protein
MRPSSGWVLGLILVGVSMAGAPARANAGAARSPGSPLLVIVETGPGAGCDAEAVRKAIAAELGSEVAALASTPVVALAGPRADVLVVAIDRDRIVVTWRGRGDHDLTRSAAAPAERAARLLVLALLAGNVARDQGASPTLPEALAAPGAPAAPTSHPALAAPAPSATRTEESLTLVRAEGLAPPSEFPGWTLSLGVGAATTFRGPYTTAQTPVFSSPRPRGQLEAHRHEGRWFYGAAVDLGPRGVHPFGAAVLFGRQWVPGRVRLEVSGGLGVERFVETGECSDCLAPIITTYTRGYLRAVFAASYPVSRQLDLVGQVDGHLTMTTEQNGGLGGATFGMRVRLP